MKFTKSIKFTSRKESLGRILKRFTFADYCSELWLDGDCFWWLQLRLIVESETKWHNNNKKTIWCWCFFHWRDKQCDVRAMQWRFYFSVCHDVLKMESDYNLYCIHTFPLHLSSKYGWFTRVATATVITMHGPQGGARAPLNARCSGWIYPKLDCFKQEKRLTSLTGIYSMDNINTDQEMHLA